MIVSQMDNEQIEQIPLSPAYLISNRAFHPIEHTSFHRTSSSYPTRASQRNPLHCASPPHSAMCPYPLIPPCIPTHRVSHRTERTSLLYRACYSTSISSHRAPPTGYLIAPSAPHSTMRVMPPSISSHRPSPTRHLIAPSAPHPTMHVIPPGISSNQARVISLRVSSPSP